MRPHRTDAGLIGRERMKSRRGADKIEYSAPFASALTCDKLERIDNPEAGGDTNGARDLESSLGLHPHAASRRRGRLLRLRILGETGKKAVDPNAYPEDYKKDVLAYVKTHPGELLNAREASISTPALKQFGTQSRYFACLRVNGPDWRKEKMLVFYSGGINQFIDAEGDQCGAAAYQPFPELVTQISELKGKK